MKIESWSAPGPFLESSEDPERPQEVPGRSQGSQEEPQKSFHGQEEPQKSFHEHSGRPLGFHLSTQ